MALLGSPPSKWKIDTGGNIQAKKPNTSVRIENASPNIIYKETGAALPLGLSVLGTSTVSIGVDVQLLVWNINTAAAGDFSTSVSPFLTFHVPTFGSGGTQVKGSGDAQAHLAVGPDPFTTTSSWRLRQAGDVLTIDRATDAPRLYATFDTYLMLDGATPEIKALQPLRIESTDPQIRLRDTDGVLPSGLWRIRLDAAFDSLRVEMNTAAAGDFSSTTQAFEVIPHPNGESGVLMLMNGGISLGLVDPVKADTTEIFADSTDVDGRLHYKDNSGVDHTVAYTSELVGGGNTVLVSEYTVRETPAGAVNGVNTTFTLAFTPEVGTEEVYLNGLLQDEGGANDYTIVGVTITFAVAPLTGDKVRVTYIQV